MPTVTKAELAHTISRETGLTMVLSLEAVDCLFDALRESIQNGGRIEIRGFGSWTVKDTKPKLNARNPRSGEVVSVPARRKVRFKAGNEIRKVLSQPLE